jgi:hypothetical protein
MPSIIEVVPYTSIICMIESVNMGDELPGARFCKIQKIQNLNFRKIREKY